MKQSGTILLQTLVFIILLAITSITMVNLTHSEIQTTRAYQQQLDTFTQAQNALSEAETWLAALPKRQSIQHDCSNLPCIKYLSTTHDWYNPAYWQKQSTNNGSEQQPRFYIIELLDSDINTESLITTEYYQITASSWSLHNQSRRIVQRVVSKQFDKYNNALTTTAQRHSWRLIR